MREIKYTTRFQRDYKREKAGRHCKKLDAQLMEVVNLLAADTPLPDANDGKMMDNDAQPNRQGRRNRSSHQPHHL
jgi:mRNA interferase YafQ